MKKIVLICLYLGLCGCVASINTQEIEQSIASDETVTKKIEEIKSSDKYTSIIKTAKRIKEINQKESFNANDIEELERYGTDSVSTKFSKYWEKDTSTKEGINGDFNTSYNTSIFTIATNLANSYKEKYCGKNRTNAELQNKTQGSIGYNVTQRKIENYQKCNSIVKNYLYSELFSEVEDWDKDIVNKKIKYYYKKIEEINFERKTGCQSEKTLRIDPIYYVLQQTNTGTLYAMPQDFMYTGLPRVIFVTYNKYDSKLVDDEPIKQGYFQQIGTHQYTSVSGGTNTVKKYKRCIED